MGDLFLDEQAYDLVGSTVGAIPKNRKVLPAKDDMKAGDVLLGLSSDGCHSNGFSLIRKILERSRLGLKDKAPWANGEANGEGIGEANGILVGESLLTPTRIYVKPLLEVVQKNLVKGMAHITGGGLIENVPRMLPQHLAAEMDVKAWKVPEVLKWMKVKGRLDDKVSLLPKPYCLLLGNIAILISNTFAAEMVNLLFRIGSMGSMKPGSQYMLSRSCCLLISLPLTYTYRNSRGFSTLD